MKLPSDYKNIGVGMLWRSFQRVLAVGLVSLIMLGCGTRQIRTPIDAYGKCLRNTGTYQTIDGRRVSLGATGLGGADLETIQSTLNVGTKDAKAISKIIDHCYQLANRMPTTEVVSENNSTFGWWLFGGGLLVTAVGLTGQSQVNAAEEDLKTETDIAKRALLKEEVENRDLAENMMAIGVISAAVGLYFILDKDDNSTAVILTGNGMAFSTSF